MLKLSLENKERIRSFVRILAVVYLITATILLLFPDPEWLFNKAGMGGVYEETHSKHVVLFAGMSFLLGFGSKKIPTWGWFPILCVYGISIEIIQPYFNRTFSLLDFRDDMIGAAIGLGIVWPLRTLFFCAKKPE